MRKQKLFTRKDYEELQRFIAGLYPDIDSPLEPAIPLDNSSFEAFRTFNLPTLYTWVTNIQQMEIRKIEGIKKCLGYDGETFTLYTALNMIHPAFQSFVVEYAREMYIHLRGDTFKQLARQTIYQIQFPVRNVHGEYYLVSQFSRIYSFDNEGFAIENINLFVITKLYENEPVVVRPYLRLNMGGYLDKETNVLIKAVTTRLNKEFRFLTPKEKEVAGYHVQGLINEEIAEATRTSVANIARHNRNILAKASRFFPSLFKDASEVARYYQALGLIE